VRVAERRDDDHGFTVDISELFVLGPVAAAELEKDRRLMANLYATDDQLVDAVRRSLDER
jgi:hypothetical protein